MCPILTRKTKDNGVAASDLDRLRELEEMENAAVVPGIDGC